MRIIIMLTTLFFLFNIQLFGNNIRLELNLGSEKISGQKTVDLRAAITNLNRIDLKAYTLSHLRLVAKSEKNNAHAVLQVGNYRSATRIIDGFPSEFTQNRKDTFDVLAFISPDPHGVGDWKLIVEGTAILEKVIVTLRPGHSVPFFVKVSAKDCRNDPLGPFTVSSFKKTNDENGTATFTGQTEFTGKCKETYNGTLTITVKVDSAKIKLIENKFLAYGVPILSHECKATYTNDRWVGCDKVTF